MQTVTLSLAAMNGVQNKTQKAEHLKLQIICIIAKWVTGHCAWSTRAAASRLAVCTVLWQYGKCYVKCVAFLVTVWYYYATNHFCSRESACQRTDSDGESENIFNIWKVYLLLCNLYTFAYASNKLGPELFPSNKISIKVCINTPQLLWSSCRGLELALLNGHKIILKGLFTQLLTSTVVTSYHEPTVRWSWHPTWEFIKWIYGSKCLVC